jgi:hypothetical protein
MINSQCCICGPAKNCGPYITTVLENAEKIGSLFKDYIIIVFYDESSDNTLLKLNEFRIKNNKLNFFINKRPISKFRTHNIAFARNFCLNFVLSNQDKYPFFIMMDLDEVNCKHINTSILPKYFEEENSLYKWDALSFNSSPKYYDIWGLSIFPFCFSYNHFENNTIHNYHIIQNYVTNQLNSLKPGKLLSCISSFNGLSIYKTEKFLNCLYDGRPRIDLVPKKYIIAHSKASHSSLVFNDFGHIHGKFEDCEHRIFHIMAKQKNAAKIRISPELLFD